MAKKGLEKALLEAAELAKKLPENLQEAGFNRALDQILGKDAPSHGGRQRDSKNSRRKRTNPGDEPDKGNRAADLIDAIDRTAYPDVGATNRVADRALKVLELAHRDHSVDGLTASEIAHILSAKFRLSVKANSITKALERETETVDLLSGSGSSRVFRIMASGEAYLEKLRAGTTPGERRKGTKKPSTKKTSRPVTTKAGRKGAEKKIVKKAPRKKATGRPGAKALIGELIEAGFFVSGRTISTIQEELQQRRGYSYKVSELSTPLLRYVRDEVLRRKRNEERQYEYTRA